jgi:hypothetical protein
MSVMTGVNGVANLTFFIQKTQFYALKFINTIEICLIFSADCIFSYLQHNNPSIIFLNFAAWRKEPVRIF